MISTPIHTGMIVTYEDMANSPRTGIIVEHIVTRWASEWGIRWEDGTYSTSDCRQNGWNSPVDSPVSGGAA